MSRAWRIMGIIILIIFVAGIVSAGIGLLTGASADRMAENIFGGWEGLELILDTVAAAVADIFPGQYGVSFVS